MHRNKGVATIEACLILPVFLFFMLGMVNIANVFFVESRIHQSLAEAAISTAQYEYKERKLFQKNNQNQSMTNKLFLHQKFNQYLNNDIRVQYLVDQGEKGIYLTIKEDIENPKVFIVKARYKVKFSLPFIGSFHKTYIDTIKQKYFIGFSKEENSDEYVFVTPYESVYHTKRSCTHLNLEIVKVKGKGNKRPCRFCGKNYGKKGQIYITKSSNVYHCNKNCSGLKRSVTRVKLKQVKGLKRCERCGTP